MPHPQQRPPASPSDQRRQLPATARAAQAPVAKRLAPSACGDSQLKLWRMHRQQVKALGWLKLVLEP